MQLYPESFNIISPIGSPGKVAEIELYLIPALVKSHGHCADERLDPGSALVVRGPEPPADVFIVEYLHLEREVFLQIFDDHDEKRQLDAERLLWIGRACDERGAYVGADDLEHKRLNVIVCDTLNVTIPHLHENFTIKHPFTTLQNNSIIFLVG